MLIYRNRKLVEVEAKALDEELTEGVGQAKNHAGKLAVRFAYSTNGQGIYQVDMFPAAPAGPSGPHEGAVHRYPTPDELKSPPAPHSQTLRQDNITRTVSGLDVFVG